MSDVNMEQMPDLGRFVDYVWSLKAERDQLRAELEAIRGQQAVAWVSPDVAGGVRWSVGALQQLSDGSPLYSLPPQQPEAVSDDELDALWREIQDTAMREPGHPHIRFARAILSTKNAE